MLLLTLTLHVTPDHLLRPVATTVAMKYPDDQNLVALPHNGSRTSGCSPRICRALRLSIVRTSFVGQYASIRNRAR